MIITIHFIVSQYLYNFNSILTKKPQKRRAGGGLMEMMSGFTVLRLTSMMGMMNISFTKEELLKMNKKLNRIKKPKNL